MNERTKRKCAIIEVTSSIYKHVKDNKSKLFVGNQSCRVFDIINSTPCNKCVRFGHSSKKSKIKPRVISVQMHTYHQSVQVH